MNNKSRKMHGLLLCRTKSGEEEGKRIRRNTCYPSIFTQHAVQPKTTNNATSASPTNTVISAPIFIEEQRLQPMSESNNSSNNSTDNDNDKFPGKKRLRSTNPTTTETATTTDELRIEATTSSNNDYDMNVIIDEIAAATTNNNNRKYPSLYLKGIRVSSSKGSSSRLCEENNNKNDILLLQALKDLVKHQAGSSSWRTIKVHNCSPSIVEAVLLSSPNSIVNFEEIHLVNMHDDDDNDGDGDEETNNDDSSILLQPIQSSNRASIKHVEQATTSTLIMNLLKKTVRLKRLVLKDCNLRDSNLFQIMNILCCNHSKTLESLDIRYNMFTSISIRSVLAIHLRSSLHSLKSISLRQGIRCVVNPKVRDAILQGLQHNRVILESIDIFDYDRYIQHFLDINRFGRQTVLCDKNFPRSLWPTLLERTTPTTKNITTGRRRIDARQANVVYHMFRNGGPVLLQQQQ